MADGSPLARAMDERTTFGLLSDVGKIIGFSNVVTQFKPI